MSKEEEDYPILIPIMENPKYVLHIKALIIFYMSGPPMSNSSIWDLGRIIHFTSHDSALYVVLYVLRFLGRDMPNAEWRYERG